MSPLLLLAALSASPVVVDTAGLAPPVQHQVFDAVVDAGFVVAPAQRKDVPVLQVSKGPDGTSIRLFADATRSTSLMPGQQVVPGSNVAGDAVMWLSSHVLLDDNLPHDVVGVRVSDARSTSDVRAVRGALVQQLAQQQHAVVRAQPKAAHTVCITLDDKEVRVGVGKGLSCNAVGKRFARPPGQAKTPYIAFVVKHALQLLDTHLDTTQKTAPSTTTKTQPTTTKTAQKPSPKAPMPVAPPSVTSSNPEVGTPSASRQFSAEAAPLGSPSSRLGPNQVAPTEISGETFADLLSPQGVRLSARGGFLARPPKNDVVLGVMARSIHKGDLHFMTAADAVLWNGSAVNAFEVNLYAGIGYRVLRAYDFELDAGLLVGGNFFHHGDPANALDAIPGAELAAGIHVDVTYPLYQDLRAVLGLRVVGTSPRFVFDGLNIADERGGTGAFVTLGLTYDVNLSGLLPQLPAFDPPAAKPDATLR